MDTLDYQRLEQHLDTFICTGELNPELPNLWNSCSPKTIRSVRNVTEQHKDNYIAISCEIISLIPETKSQQTPDTLRKIHPLMEKVIKEVPSTKNPLYNKAQGFFALTVAAGLYLHYSKETTESEFPKINLNAALERLSKIDAPEAREVLAEAKAQGLYS